MPVVSQADLERSAAFRKLLANPEFMLAVAFWQNQALTGFTNARGEELIRTQGAWNFALHMIATLESDIESTEKVQRARLEAIKTRQGEAPPPVAAD